MTRTPEGRILRRFIAAFISSFLAQFLVLVEQGKAYEDLNKAIAISLIAAVFMALDKLFREIKNF